jgi:hypothetical protein
MTLLIFVAIAVVVAIAVAVAIAIDVAIAVAIVIADTVAIHLWDGREGMEHLFPYLGERVLRLSAIISCPPSAEMVNACEKVPMQPTACMLLSQLSLWLWKVLILRVSPQAGNFL